MTKNIVWINKETSELIISNYIDSMFYSLQKSIQWDKIEALGFLEIGDSDESKDS